MVAEQGQEVFGLGERPAEAPVEVVAVTVAHGERRAMELFSLVLLSVNISHRVIRTGARWRVDVRPADLAAARHHLTTFNQENRGWPPPVAEVTFASSQGWALMALVAALSIFFGVTGPWREGSLWFLRGAVDSRLVFSHGELWRVVTGLTLHADVSHFLGNVVLGGVVLSYLAGQTGGGAVWFLALFTGGLGNYMNVLYHHGGNHRFVGFSTAVFGVIGCLCGLRMMNLRRMRLRSILLPIGAGAGLLAMLGTEGEKTDVGAHLWGLGVGLTTGLLWHWLIARRLTVNRWAQFVMGIGSFLAVVAAWWLAMAS